MRAFDQRRRWRNLLRREGQTINTPDAVPTLRP
jgi:hypothetical protein